MKILPIEKVRQADAYTIKNEPIKSTDLMERAGTQIYNWIINHIEKSQTVKVFCGLGNNAGDGLVVARLLVGKKYKVQLNVIRFSKKTSDDFETNYKRLEKLKGLEINNINKVDKIPEIYKNDIIVDAIFGSGLSRPVEGFIGDVILKINRSKALIIALDAPSGLFCDESSINHKGKIIEADYTLTFQFPKYAFLFPENDKYVGKWEVLPIGLHKDFIDSVEVKNYLIEKNDCLKILKKRNKFSHKGNYGHALLISGGYGKMGAAVLASKACLRSGAGLLTTHIPAKGYNIVQTAVPEAMTIIDENEEYFSEVPDLSNYDVIGVGPGIGTEKQTQNALKLLIQNSGVPIVFDADAINILGENKTWLSFIPEGSIFTPHPKEFERLAGKSKNNFDRIEMQKEFSFKYKSYVVLKGAHTSITTPNGDCFFNSTGNPGMASGGSGDILTGIVLGLLAQGYHSLEAAILGVYLHGLAGDIAAGKQSEEAMIASDIVESLGEAIKSIRD
ncbi:MAG: NAD(P)H-hydrate dehydratase [Bacteroidales bacterium]|nr:NAD(P)H-hydrate dehydratase [Bacteroidales bacterium]